MSENAESLAETNRETGFQLRLYTGEGGKEDTKNAVVPRIAREAVAFRIQGLAARLGVLTSTEAIENRNSIHKPVIEACHALMQQIEVAVRELLTTGDVRAHEMRRAMSTRFVDPQGAQNYRNILNMRGMKGSDVCELADFYVHCQGFAGRVKLVMEQGMKTSEHTEALDYRP